jgi:hypothetical protein
VKTTKPATTKISSKKAKTTGANDCFRVYGKLWKKRIMMLKKYKKAYGTP